MQGQASAMMCKTGSLDMIRSNGDSVGIWQLISTCNILQFSRQVRVDR